MGRYKSREIHSYPEEALKEALKAIREDHLGIREASRRYGVPRGTIQDRLHCRVKEGPRKMGPPTVLSEQEENELVQWLTEIAKCGFPQKKGDFIRTVGKFVAEKQRKSPFRNNIPGQKWYQNFIKRHKNICLREAEGLTKARSIVTEESIRKWFRELHTFLEESEALDILQDPRRICNGDETSFAMCPKTGKVLAPKGYKNIYEVKMGSEKETITVLLVFSADGRTMPPMVVFPFVRPNKALVDSVPLNWFIGRSETGWMRSDTFFEYIANGVNKWIEDNKIPKPILLLVDGHKSHLSLELSRFCHEHGIILYALPPNTTHILQPADVSVFKALKTNWKKTIRSWQMKPDNCNKVLTKCTFCPLLRDVLNDETLPQSIQNGFRKCGLYPMNPDAVDYAKCIKNRIEKLHAGESNSLDVTQQQLQTAQEVLQKLNDTLTERGILNVGDICQQLQNIQQEFYSPQSETTYVVVENGMLEPVEGNASNELLFNFDELTDYVDKNEVSETCVVKVSEYDVSEVNATTSYTCSSVENDNVKNPEIAIKKLEETEKAEYNEHVNKILEVGNSKQDNISEGVVLVDIENEYNRDNQMPEVDVNADGAKEINIAEKDESKENDVNRMNHINVLQDVIVNPANEDSNTLKKHLFFPTPLTPSTKRGSRDRPPAAISSAAFRDHLERKIMEKKNAEEEKEKRKAERLRLSLQRSSKNVNKRKKTTGSSANVATSTRYRINKKKKCLGGNTKPGQSQLKAKELCSTCNEILDSDCEENELKNIGCDVCPKWFHLKCTPFRDCLYEDVKKSEFVCLFCTSEKS